MSGLREYLKAKGAKTLTVENCPALAEYDRAMREEVIPAIERDLKAQRRAAHFLRLGIPDPLASADTRPEGGDGTKIAAPSVTSGAVGSEASETPNPSSSPAAGR